MIPLNPLGIPKDRSDRRLLPLLFSWRVHKKLSASVQRLLSSRTVLPETRKWRNGLMVARAESPSSLEPSDEDRGDDDGGRWMAR